MPTPEAAKKAIRERARDWLGELSPAERHERSARICDRVMGLPAFERASTTMLYLPLPGEVDILPLALRCFQTGRTVAAPRVDWDRGQMTPVEIHCFDDETEGLYEVRRHGVREPSEGRLVHPTELDLVLVPGLAFAEGGRRVGRGGGFYDRFLARLRGALHTRIVGVCFDEQVVEDIPVEAHDALVDVIATETRLIAGANRPEGRPSTAR